MLKKFVALVAGLGLTLAGSSSARAGEALPVHHNFLVGAVLAGATGQSDAPGTNDWACRPTAAHPRPVVLVHGTFGNQATNWQTYGPLLKNNGYCVFALTYGALPVPGLNILGGLGDTRTSAAQVRTFVDRVLKSTGARQVDLIGHSQGTVVPQYWIKNLGGAGKVKHYVSLAPVWQGTNATRPLRTVARLLGGEHALPLCTACPQMAPGSDYLRGLAVGGLATPGVTYTNITTRYDELVLPYTQGFAPGMRNLVIQNFCALDFSDHLEIAADPVAAQVVLNTLDPGRKRPVSCRVVLPAIGG